MNLVTIVGNLTADPEIKITPNGVPVTRVTVAVNRMPNSNGEKKADYINVVIWRKQADSVVKYCVKGTKLGIIGRIQTHSYDGQNGQKRYITEVLASEVHFLGGKKNGEQVSQTSYKTQELQVAQVQTTLEEEPFTTFGQEVIINDEDLPF